MLLRWDESFEKEVEKERVHRSVSLIPLYGMLSKATELHFVFVLFTVETFTADSMQLSPIVWEWGRRGSGRAGTSILPLQSLQDTYHECDGFSRWIDSNSGASHYEQAQTRNIKLANETIIDDINKLRKYTWPVHRQDIDDCPINSDDNDSA